MGRTANARSNVEVKDRKDERFDTALLPHIGKLLDALRPRNPSLPADYLPPGNACGAESVNDQLLASDNRAGRGLHPGEGLLRQTGHLIAFGAEEMDVIPGAVAGGSLAMRAEAPRTVRPLDAVQETGLLQRFESAIDCYPVTGPRSFPSQDVLMRQRPPRLGKQVQYGFPRSCSSQSSGLQQIGGFFHAMSVVKFSIARLQFMQLCCK